MKTIDLNNSENLDMVSDGFSNIVGIFQSGQVCPKPLVAENRLNRSKWNAYRACLAREEQKRRDELAEAERQRQFELEQAKIKAEQKKIEAQTQQQRDVLIGQQLTLKQQEREAARSGKFLGMPIPLAIGLGVLLLGGISFGIYKLVKK